VKKLHISSELSLTDDLVTKTIAILAQRRKGKTYTASVIAEEMVAALVPFVVLDPTGAWYGMRTSADGKKPGLPVVILGGQYGDLPLERGAGKFIADLVLDHPGWYVIDFSLFESGGAERQFATDFAERLYRRKGQSGMDFAMHLFVDEADRFVPQRISGGRGDGRESDQRLLGAFEAIVRRGGLRGLGTTLISQRAAVVNKNVLEQIDLLIMLRIMGPNDRRAIEDYLKADADDEQRKILMGSLASLDIGEAWLWEPGGEPPLFDRVHIRERRTFNSSATPKPGQRRVEPSKFAEVDLQDVKTEMAGAIERATADDPKILRARIKELETQLAKKPQVETVVETVTVTETVVSVPRSVVEAMEGLDDGALALMNLIGDMKKALEAEEVTTTNSTSKVDPRGVLKKGLVSGRGPAPTVPPRRRAEVAVSSVEVSLSKAEKSILSVLAQFPEGRSRRQVAMLSGYSVTSGSFANSLSKLRVAGFINERGEPILATPNGLSAIFGHYEPLPSGPALLDHWNSKLSKAERAIVEVLIEVWPKSLTKFELAERTEYQATSGSFANSLSRLRTLELINRGTDIRVDETLAAEARS
jgi:uncharacterized protein